MKSIQLSNKGSAVIMKLASFIGIVLLSLTIFLFAFSLYLHWEFPLGAFLAISLSFFVLNTVLGIIYSNYYAGFFIYFMDFYWNHQVMDSDGSGDEKPTVRIFSACGFYVAMLLLLISFFVPKAWLLITSALLTLQYIIVVVLTVFVAAKKLKKAPAQDAS